MPDAIIETWEELPVVVLPQKECTTCGDTGFKPPKRTNEYRIHFDGDIGECSEFAHTLKAHAEAGNIITVLVRDTKQACFLAAGQPLHLYSKRSQFTKVGTQVIVNNSEPYDDANALPGIDASKIVLDGCANLPDYIKARIDRLAAILPRPRVLLSGKWTPDDAAELANQTGGIVITIEKGIEKNAHGRVLRLREDLADVTTGELIRLIANCNMIAGADTPLTKLARQTTTKVVICDNIQSIAGALNA